MLLGSTDGVFLGDPRFEELMAELERRQATVFVHPNMHATSEQIGLQTPGFLIEFLCDTTRAAVNLILSGTLERYPRIRWMRTACGRRIPSTRSIAATRLACFRTIVCQESRSRRPPIYAAESFSGHIRRGMVKPLGALAERIRNR
ncbi:hypothetical protein [Pseudomonas panipatensis]|uniref:hypothetical protein n=1 Tax=Pseudomonas panipatensis TaxID=428992 RepID=UPI001FCCD131|nr:hypothetical protein [Pseudomonas panipatensis]